MTDTPPEYIVSPELQERANESGVSWDIGVSRGSRITVDGPSYFAKLAPIETEITLLRPSKSRLLGSACFLSSRVKGPA